MSHSSGKRRAPALSQHPWTLDTCVRGNERPFDALLSKESNGLQIVRRASALARLCSAIVATHVHAHVCVRVYVYQSVS